MSRSFSGRQGANEGGGGGGREIDKRVPDRSYANLVLGVESGCAIPGGSRTGAADAHAGVVPPGSTILDLEPQQNLSFVLFLRN